MTDESLVEWREWGTAAFAEAQDRDVPLLGFLTAPWCTWCDRMETEGFGSPMIAANVAEGFVPVRVDADRHPAVRERYQMGGFPSTVFLTPDGRLLSGATYLDPEGLRSVVERVREMWEERGSDAGRVPRALRDPDPPRGALDDRIESHMAGQLEVSFDEQYGGWGTEAKFPLARTVEFALKRDRTRALQTLDAVAGHLADPDGGFYRYATNRDWSEPHYERLLDENAALVRAFANAYLHTGDERYRDVADDAISYLTTTLWARDTDVGGTTDLAGAFAGSQAGEESYFEQPPEDRPDGSPGVDETVFADRNGLTVEALLWYHAYTDDAVAREYARTALHTVLDTLEREGTVAHHEGGPEGLLTDQARLFRALTTAAQVLGGGRYVDAAVRVADRTLDTLFVGGTFLDGPADDEALGLLDRPLRPIDTTVEVADALVDLAGLTGEERYREVARESLEAFAGARDRMGVDVAGYASAVSRVVSRPLTVEVTSEAGSDLHRAALRIADHEKVVVPNATLDGETGDDDGPLACVTLHGERALADTPAELQRRVSELN
ncbi:DUF255 domain-containing protein [Halomarina oriensis]|uniref:DUF255 domain-containing protein n=1 Tax=Halomarina oriensis TaxID=671145 RepID=A0A6B0GJY1_9EURY|nr:DUF255 domain-containing protein [Halomarina oriensis]MWG34171.1 DUF255 domain-containing protein [Halomarina oriensis]